MDRREFLRKSGIGLVSLAVLSKFGVKTEAAPVNDNLVNGSTNISASAPSDKSNLWVDIANGGTLKYWDGSKWKPIRTTWDE